MKGQVTVPTTPAINPVATGVRVILENADPATLLDVVVPGGTYNPVTHTGWRPNPTNTRWVYKGGSPTPANPISGITVSTSPRTPGVYKFAVRGKNGSFPTTPSDTPLRGTFVIDQPTADTGQCSEISSPRTPGVYKFAVRGKNGSFPTTPSDTPLRGTFVIDQPTADTGQCSEIT